MPRTAPTAQEVTAVPVTNHQRISQVGRRQLITGCMEDCGEEKKNKDFSCENLNVFLYEISFIFSAVAMFFFHTFIFIQ